MTSQPTLTLYYMYDVFVWCFIVWSTSCHAFGTELWFTLQAILIQRASRLGSAGYRQG